MDFPGESHWQSRMYAKTGLGYSVGLASYKRPQTKRCKYRPCIAGSYTFFPNFTGVGKFLGGLSDDQNLSPNKQLEPHPGW